MAKLGTLSMDTGSDGSGRPTAVAFWLKTNPGFNVQVSPLGSDWEVELQQNQDAVVARCNAALNSADALRGGREAVEEALDRVCFRFNDPLEVKSAEESHLILTTDGGKNELTYNMAAPLEVRLRPIEATVIDKYGTTQTQGTTPMTWMPVLRYYRLSQTRDDIFDAYRYMFLAFEALLHGLYPIKRKERERDWMLRALAKVAKKVSLGRFISGAATDPVRAFIDGQYGNVRLRLFHAKKSSQTQPHEGIPEADVARAYSDLTRFCREVLNQCYGLGGQSGVMTNVWFQNTVQANLASGVEFACSEDPSPFDPAQTKFCPQGFPSYSLHELNIDYPPASGTVRLIAALDLNDELRKLAIRRVGAVKGDTAVAVSAFDSELLLTGLDRFRCIMKLTLRNLNTPRRLD